jgi:hypothetical protein
VDLRLERYRVYIRYLRRCSCAEDVRRTWLDAFEAAAAGSTPPELQSSVAHLAFAPGSGSSNSGGSGGGVEFVGPADDSEEAERELAELQRRHGHAYKAAWDAVHRHWEREEGVPGSGGGGSGVRWRRREAVPEEQLPPAAAGLL